MSRCTFFNLKEKNNVFAFKKPSTNGGVDLCLISWIVFFYFEFSLISDLYFIGHISTMLLTMPTKLNFPERNEGYIELFIEDCVLVVFILLYKGDWVALFTFIR